MDAMFSKTLKIGWDAQVAFLPELRLGTQQETLTVQLNTYVCFACDPQGSISLQSPLPEPRLHFGKGQNRTSSDVDSIFALRVRV